MKYTTSITPSVMCMRMLQAALALSLSLLLAACGGGGEVITSPAKRSLSAEVLTRNAVNYAPYRTSQVESDRANENITEAMIKQDLDLLVAGNFRLIRLFDSSDKVAKQTLKVIRDNNLDIKVMLGVWIASGNDTFNQAEIVRAVALAKQYQDIVVAVSVGNETMVSWSFNPLTTTQMAGYIKQVRDLVTQPVTTDDNWAFFAQSSTNEKNPRPVIDIIDFVALHTYPLAETVNPPATWDWQQLDVKPAGPARAVAMMDASIAAAKKQYEAVRTNLNRLGFASMPIVIGETGWKAVASDGEFNRAHPVNQKMYFDRLNAWMRDVRAGSTGPQAIFYFAAFDEEWKGADDKWGLFNKAREARFAIKDLYAGVSGVTFEAGTYTEANALFAPDVTDAVVTGSRFTVYADSVPTGESAAVASGADWFGWDANPVTASAGEFDLTTAVEGAPDDSGHGSIVKPSPKVWGWGAFIAPRNATVVADLSAFETNGTLNFSIRTTYPGKIEVGFATGSGATAYDVYIPLTPGGQYGYNNDNKWYTVSIPIKDIKPFGNRAETDAARNSPTSVFNLANVTSPFVIADRFGRTGNNQASASNTKIYVDNIYWKK